MRNFLERRLRLEMPAMGCERRVIIKLQQIGMGFRSMPHRADDGDIRMGDAALEQKFPCFSRADILQRRKRGTDLRSAALRPDFGAIFMQPHLIKQADGRVGEAGGERGHFHGMAALFALRPKPPALRH